MNWAFDLTGRGLERMDRNREVLMPLFNRVYGEDSVRWFQRWRLFFLACSELFRYRRGQEWWVSHYLWTQRRDDRSGATKELARAS